MKKDLNHDDVAISLMRADSFKHTQITGKSSEIFNIFVVLLSLI